MILSGYNNQLSNYVSKRFDTSNSYASPLDSYVGKVKNPGKCGDTKFVANPNGSTAPTESLQRLDINLSSKESSFPSPPSLTNTTCLSSSTHTLPCSDANDVLRLKENPYSPAVYPYYPYFHSHKNHASHSIHSVHDNSAIFPYAPLESNTGALSATDNGQTRIFDYLQRIHELQLAGGGAPQPIIIQNRTEVATHSDANTSAVSQLQNNNQIQNQRSYDRAERWIPKWLRRFWSSRLNRVFVISTGILAVYMLKEHYYHSCRIAQLQQRVNSNILLRTVQMVDYALGRRRYAYF